MTPLADLLQQGAAHAWLFIPSAILLGALHGLEPGHSKTMMAAFIIAVHGTVAQAVLLGLAATISHTFVVWLVALVGLHFASQLDPQTSEPYFQVASAVLIIGIAAWMIARNRPARQPVTSDHHHDRHTHRHDATSSEHDHHHAAGQDAHERAHASAIRRRFVGQQVTTGQIVMFGLTGGLIPCPAAITVLLLCLQLRQFTLGVALVLCFSIGLAITMVTAGVIAALGVQHIGRRWSGFGTIAARAPYFSGVLIGCVGLYVGWQGLRAIAAAGGI